MTAPTKERARTCRTPDDAFEAGWADAANDQPLTEAEIDRLLALHARHLHGRDAA